MISFFSARTSLFLPIFLLFWAGLSGCGEHVFRSALPVDDENFRREVLEAARPVLVLFHHDGASAARAAYGPIVDGLAASGSNLVKTCVYSVGSDAAFHEKYGFEIVDLPVLFQGGRPIRAYGRLVSEEVEARAALLWVLAPLLFPPTHGGVTRPAMLLEENYERVIGDASGPAVVAFSPIRNYRQIFVAVAEAWSGPMHFYWCTDPVVIKRCVARQNEVLVFHNGREVGRFEGLARSYPPANEVDVLKIAHPYMAGASLITGASPESGRRKLPLPPEELDECLRRFAGKDGDPRARLQVLRSLERNLDAVVAGRLLSILRDRLSRGKLDLALPSGIEGERVADRFEERLDMHLSLDPDLAALVAILRSPLLEDYGPFAPFLRSENELLRATVARGLSLGNGGGEGAANLLFTLTRDPSALVRFVAYRGLVRQSPHADRWPTFLVGLRSGDRRIAEGIASALERWATPELADALARPPDDLRPALVPLLEEAAVRARRRKSPWPSILLGCFFFMLLLGLGALSPFLRRRHRRQGELRASLALIRQDDYEEGLAALYRYTNGWMEELDRAWLWLAVAHLKRNELTAALDAMGHVHLPACSPLEIYELATQLQARELDDQAIKLLRHLEESRGGHADSADRLQRLSTAPESQENPDRSVAGIVDILRRELPDRYASIQHLCWGGMAAVFTANDTKNGERVAIKVLDPRFEHDDGVVRRFYREAVAVSNLDHPNIPGIRSVKRAELPFYVMEFIEGESLEALLAREGKLSIPRALALGRQIAAALAQAHSKGIVHRDVKPANVLVGADGRARLVDFGIARFDETTGVTATGQILGTPRYMSPEQLKGEKVGPPTDVYSFGVTLYLALSGQLPFPSESPYERIFKDCIPLGARFDCEVPGLCELVDACLNRAFEKRPRDGRALVDALVSLPA